jgi:hypothetical protein
MGFQIHCTRYQIERHAEFFQFDFEIRELPVCEAGQFGQEMAGAVVHGFGLFAKDGAFGCGYVGQRQGTVEIGVHDAHDIAIGPGAQLDQFGGKFDNRAHI